MFPPDDNSMANVLAAGQNVKGTAPEVVLIAKVARLIVANKVTNVDVILREVQAERMAGVIRRRRPSQLPIWKSSVGKLGPRNC
jgi:DNA-binding LytR/AlgR family response regulator